MLDPLELANRVIINERSTQTLYGQLEDSLSATRYIRTIQNLRILQARQVSILNSLINDLEQEEMPVPAGRYYAQHILQIGETLKVLALEYNTSVTAIKRLNPGLSANPQAGQMVNLPVEIPEPSINSIRYYVRPGDTIYDIARRYNTDVETLIRLNSITEPDIIFPGRILIIPGNGV